MMVTLAGNLGRASFCGRVGVFSKPTTLTHLLSLSLSQCYLSPRSLLPSVPHYLLVSGPQVDHWPPKLAADDRDPVSCFFLCLSMLVRDAARARSNKQLGRILMRRFYFEY